MYGDVESCGVCGGDGYITNALGGSSKRCPACGGTGRRNEEPLMRDVTKTKPSHYQPTNKKVKPEKQTWPSTHQGDVLAKEVKAATCDDQMKERLIREIIDYEGTHGTCTQTFTKKLRKQLRAYVPAK